MEQKNPGVAYLLLAMSVFGLSGLHRFYLGKPVTGIIWLFTFGLLGVGTLVDLFYVPLMVETENRRLGFGSAPPPRQLVSGLESAPGPVNPEQAILKLAKENDGRVTVAMVALGTGLSLRKAQSTLERLCKDGYAERDVSSEGANLYVFPGLRSNEIFDIDAI